MAIEDLGRLVKQKYPGSYDDLSDQELGQKTLKKYPQYADIANSSPSGGSQPDQVSQPSNSPSLLGFGSNVLSSSKNLASGIGQALLHPVNTARTLGSIPLGLGEKIGRGIQQEVTGQQYEQKPSEQTFNHLVDFYKNRYGSLDQLKHTAYNDPAGLVSDLSIFFSSGGGALSKIGEAGNLGKIATVGEGLSRTGELLNPVNQAVRATSAAARTGAKIAGRIGSEVTGITTGVGSAPIQEAFSNPNQAFTQALRGQTSTEDIYNTAKSGIDNLVEARRNDYLKNFTAAKNYNQSLDVPFNTAQKLSNDLLNKYRITQTMPEELNPLAQEARKYSSAEEFINELNHNGIVPKYGTRNQYYGMTEKQELQAVADGNKPAYLGQHKTQFSDELAFAKKNGLATGKTDLGDIVIGKDKASVNALIEATKKGDGHAVGIALGYEDLGKTFTKSQLTDFYNQTHDNVDFGKNGLDFSGSPISRSSGDIPKAEEAFNTVKNWSDSSVEGLDVLKRRLEDLSKTAKSGEATKFINELKGNVRTVLNTVPGYQEAMTGYREGSQAIQQAQKGLSLGDQASVDTSIRKLTSVLRQNNNFRLGLVKQLEDAGSHDIVSQIAGNALSEVAPRGLARTATQIGLGGEVGAAVLGHHNLIISLLPTLAFSSPRVVGELSRALGIGSKIGSKVTAPIRTAVGASAPYLQFLRAIPGVSLNTPSPQSTGQVQPGGI